MNHEQPDIGAAKLIALATIVASIVSAIASIFVARIAAGGALQVKAPEAVGKALTESKSEINDLREATDKLRREYEQKKWPIVQSSRKAIKLTEDYSGWDKANGPSRWFYKQTIRFEKPFKQRPQVIVSLAENPRHHETKAPLDANKFVKWAVDANTIEQDRFILEVTVFDPSIKWDVMSFNWVAHLPP